MVGESGERRNGGEVDGRGGGRKMRLWRGERKGKMESNDG